MSRGTIAVKQLNEARPLKFKARGVSTNAWWGTYDGFFSLFGLFKPVEGHFDQLRLVGLISRIEG